jgi:hypothetical protein
MLYSKKWRMIMDTKNNNSPAEKKSNTGAVIAGLLTASVLAYCGYKLVDNKLKKTKYESDPNKNV